MNTNESNLGLEEKSSNPSSEMPSFPSLITGSSVIYQPSTSLELTFLRQILKQLRMALNLLRNQGSWQAPEPPALCSRMLELQTCSTTPYKKCLLQVKFSLLQINAVVPKAAHSLSCNSVEELEVGLYFQIVIFFFPFPQFSCRDSCDFIRIMSTVKRLWVSQIDGKP